MPQLGVGVFVSALRDALHAKEIDFAVHSYKDLPTAPADGLTIAAIPTRDDPRDALIARDGRTLAELPPGARIGTGAPRRIAQLHALGLRLGGRADPRQRRHPAAQGRRGPTSTRSSWPRAGLRRLGRADEITEMLDPMLMLPAPAQGALAVECRTDDHEPRRAARAASTTQHTRAAVTAERSLLATLEAGCSAPVAGPRRRRRGPTTASLGDLSARGGVQPGRHASPSGCPRTGTLTDAAEIGRPARRRAPRRRLPTQPYWENSMTRTRKTVGRISFVGAGPGDPGLLTRRAHDALLDADHVVYDRGVPECAARRSVPRRRPTAGEAPSSARPRARRATWPRCCSPRPAPGLRAVHLVAGDPFGHDSVVKEVQAVARTAVPFEVVPGRRARPRASPPTPASPLTGVRTDRRRRRRQRRSTSTRWPPPSPRGSVALAVDAGDLAAVRDGLLAAGVDGDHRRRGHRRRHRRDAVHHDLHSGQLRRGGARLHRPGRAQPRRRTSPTGTS